jgi:methyl-accepting chemotaxis protein
VLIARDQSLLGSRFPVEAWKQGQAITRLDYQGQQRIASIVANPETGYFIVSLLDPREISTPAIQLILLLLACIVVVLGIFILVMNLILTRLIIRPLTGLSGDMAKIGGGDLACRLDTRLLARQDEIGQLAASVVDMQAQLNALTSAVHTNVLGVEGGAREIVGAVDEQAASANQMSAAVAEITSTMEELSASSTQIAEYSRSVVDIANLTWENSKKGSQAMVQLLDRISGIRNDNELSLQEIMDLGRKSKEISKVMSLINVVADQTKLIAFNAALEASSAGEAGKRFGVVAAEIRRLADSVTDSTGEIESRINEIQDSISRLVITSEKGSVGIASGMEASTMTSSILDALVDAASQTSSAAQQISLSTQQQKTASNQVVIALREIASSSQHTVDSIKRIAAVSHGMRVSAAELNGLVGQFKLADKPEA